jgi:hypothetical protein
MGFWRRSDVGRGGVGWNLKFGAWKGILLGVEK